MSFFKLWAQIFFTILLFIGALLACVYGFVLLGVAAASCFGLLPVAISIIVLYLAIVSAILTARRLP